MRTNFYDAEKTLFSDVVHSTVPKHGKKNDRGIDWDQLKRLIKSVLLPGKEYAIKSGDIYDRIKHELDWETESETYQPIRKACTMLLEEEHFPLGSCGKGYYVMDSESEIIENMDSVSNRIRGLERRQRAYSQVLEKRSAVK